MYKNRRKQARNTPLAATTIKQALQKWKVKTNKDPEDATNVNLEYQNPPIIKIGSSIRRLMKCKLLSLACNWIERPILPSSLQNLRILNLSRNNLRTLKGIEALDRTLEELWVSYNLIAKLEPIAFMKVLKVFYASHNNINEWAEVKHLTAPPLLLEISFSGNPIYQSMSEERFRREIARRLPKLAKLDFMPLLREERETSA